MIVWLKEEKEKHQQQLYSTDVENPSCCCCRRVGLISPMVCLCVLCTSGGVHMASFHARDCCCTTIALHPSTHHHHHLLAPLFFLSLFLYFCFGCFHHDHHQTRPTCRRRRVLSLSYTTFSNAKWNRDQLVHREPGPIYYSTHIQPSV